MPLTVVMGAGVSMNAGLRSWSKLVSSMADQINGVRKVSSGNRTLQEMAKLDSIDLMRKAEVILHLIKSGSHNREDHEIIRDALYQPETVLVA
jgi:hypothetical protein